MNPKNRTTYILVAVIAVLSGLLGWERFSRQSPSTTPAPVAIAASVESVPIDPAPVVVPTSEPIVAPAEEPKVWVNTKTGIWHRPGTRWYGTTKQGEYMTVEQATAAGYRAAHNGQ